jgi:hypothetical protein
MELPPRHRLQPSTTDDQLAGPWARGRWFRNPRRGLKAWCRKGSRAADHDLTIDEAQIHRRRTRLRPQRKFGVVAHARAAHALNVGISSHAARAWYLTKRGGRWRGFFKPMLDQALRRQPAPRLLWHRRRMKGRVPYLPTRNVRLESASNVLATASFTLVEVGARRWRRRACRTRRCADGRSRAGSREGIPGGLLNRLNLRAADSLPAQKFVDRYLRMWK